jgi:hypothetical protein
VRHRIGGGRGADERGTGWRRQGVLTYSGAA